MSRDNPKRRILEESDYIKSHKHGNSLAKFLARNPNEITNATIAKILLISEEEVEKIYEESALLLRKSMLGSRDED